MTDAYYGDGTGLCFWCFMKATTDYYGVPLCDDHYADEVAKDGIL